MRFHKTGKKTTLMMMLDRPMGLPTKMLFLFKLVETGKGIGGWAETAFYHCPCSFLSGLFAPPISCAAAPRSFEFHVVYWFSAPVLVFGNRTGMVASIFPSIFSYFHSLHDCSNVSTDLWSCRKLLWSDSSSSAAEYFTDNYFTCTYEISKVFM